MKRIVTALLIVLILMACVSKADWAPPNGASEGVYPGEVWRKATTPEELGWSSEKLAVARAYSEKIGSAAVMIVDDGIVVDAWGDTSQRFQCHSMRKSLLSALIGIHVDEGHIDLSKTLEDLGVDDTKPSLTDTEKQATVADLIKSRSGIYHVALGEAPSMKADRPERYSHAPGTFWYYNNWDFNALGTIFEQETGTRIFEEFDRRIAKPLQMEDFRVNDCCYLTSHDYGTTKASIHPKYQFRMSARDLARFGLLFLHEGRWRNQQIISADWIRESTTSHSENGLNSGYGYMWWTGVKGGLFPNVQVKEHSFYASGFRGHRLIVLPYRNLVIVHRVDTDSSTVDIGNREIGPLLWLILNAAGETEIGDAPIVKLAEGVQVKADNLHKTWGESTIWYLDGSEDQYITSHAPEGTLTLKGRESRELIDSGKWWVDSDKVCRQWKEMDGSEKACYYILLDGPTLLYFDLDGILAGKIHFSRD
jgi:CubicO group peptidase (beta-lactamase class C family)